MNFYDKLVAQVKAVRFENVLKITRSQVVSINANSEKTTLNAPQKQNQAFMQHEQQSQKGKELSSSAKTL